MLNSEVTISKRRWKRYIYDFKIIDYGYDDIGNWIEFLIGLETKMLALVDNSSFAESLSIERKVKYNYWKEKISSKEGSNDSRNKIVSASDLFDNDEEIAKKYADDEYMA